MHCGMFAAFHWSLCLILAVSWTFCASHSGNVGEVLETKDERGQNAQLLKDLDLEQVLDRNVENLSGTPAGMRC
jgi:hypothetical protein